MTQGTIFRMPYGFGPMPGPRQGPDGKPHDWTTGPRSYTASVRFLSTRDALEPLLPPGFYLDGDPEVEVRYTELTELAWLAGRGYRLLGVYLKAGYRGQRDTARGQFLSVLWENLADPILSGREELGYAKLPAEISAPRRVGRTAEVTASWMGFPFFRMSLEGIEDAAQAPAAPPPSDGVLHYKYIPRTGALDEADCAYACLSPNVATHRRVVATQTATATFAFVRANWEQMPTQFHIVSRLAELPILDTLPARIETAIGASDLGNQRRLE
ncbi:acetoacetate decarboxylase family protein [Microbaculum marinisediminis]|uniref:Acetoacetate decarboxylase family protein n=1 Tax=Microbaculum marinisediminis TaxID=2931392 RepID=A0AAW5R626_9HYPH|nr:acetoacetate decarboxylase family protein [Microbaculum sp. A6E488]MCT8973970.1 acetoacetate decarboxylase family protein [Microbaculum sp. A6E488]